MDIKAPASSSIKAMLINASKSNSSAPSGTPIGSNQAVAVTEINQLNISSILPAAIYHADDPVTPQNVDVDYSKITLSRSRGHKPNYDQNISEAVGNLISVGDRAKPAFADFKQQLATTFPELAGKDFGFSVQQNGNLVILNNQDALSEQEQKQVTQFINNFSGSSALSASSLKFAKASVELLEADRGYRNASVEVGKFDLTTANFSEFIDLSEIFSRKPGANWEHVDLTNQLNDSTAEIKYNRDERETYINGEWVKDFNW